MRQQVRRKLFWIAGPLLVSLAVPALAQTPPATTYQPGYWQPVARVNPKSPITVTLVNQTGVRLNYNQLDGSAEGDLPVGASKQVSGITLPSNIAVYDPSPQAATGRAGGLKYVTSGNGNDVKVTILPTRSGRDQVVNISRTGAVYIY